MTRIDKSSALTSSHTSIYGEGRSKNRTLQIRGGMTAIKLVFLNRFLLVDSSRDMNIATLSARKVRETYCNGTNSHD